MQFHTASSIEEAVRLLGGGGRILAGGTDLLVQLRSGAADPGAVIDIKRIAELGRIAREPGGWRIGAAVPVAAMQEHQDFAAAWPGVVEGANLIGSTQIKGRATVAGNLCNASPAADSVPALVAAGAVARIAGPGGVRELAVEDVPAGPGRTSLGPGEFVTSIFLPDPPPRTGDAYLRFTPRSEMDIAVVGAAVCLTLDAEGRCTAARVALGAVAPRVLRADGAARALVGTRLEADALGALARACAAAASPIDDKRGTVAFRTHVAGVLARRAAELAAARARNRAGARDGR